MVFLFASLTFQGVFIHIFPFCLGYLLAKNEYEIPNLSTYKGMILLVVGLYFYSISFGYNPLLYLAVHPSNWHLMAIGSALIILSFLKTPTLQKIELNKFLRVLGSMSYSIYLLHIFVVRNLMPFFMSYLNNHIQPNISWYIGLATSLVITIFFSAIFTKFIDKPVTALSKNLFRKKCVLT